MSIMGTSPGASVSPMARRERVPYAWNALSFVGEHDHVHDAVRLGENLDDPLVVKDIVQGERASLAVRQPLLRWFAAADAEFPCGVGNVVEALASVDPHATSNESRFVHNVVSRSVEWIGRRADSGVFHEVKTT